eukprot:357661-Chlamydomonas_euryale.AAC.3
MQPIPLPSLGACHAALALPAFPFPPSGTAAPPCSLVEQLVGQLYPRRVAWVELPQHIGQLGDHPDDLVVLLVVVAVLDVVPPHHLRTGHDAGRELQRCAALCWPYAVTANKDRQKDCCCEPWSLAAGLGERAEGLLLQALENSTRKLLRIPPESFGEFHQKALGIPPESTSAICGMRIHPHMHTRACSVHAMCNNTRGNMR